MIKTIYYNNKKVVYILCKYCLREITIDFITERGCHWCDTEYHVKLRLKQLIPK